MIMKCIELIWLCKPMKKDRNSQASVSIDSCTMNWVKHSFSLWVLWTNWRNILVFPYKEMHSIMTCLKLLKLQYRTLLTSQRLENDQNHLTKISKRDY